MANFRQSCEEISHSKVYLQLFINEIFFNVETLKKVSDTLINNVSQFISIKISIICKI